MTKEQLKYPFFLIIHPFKGYWDLKYEQNQKGSLKIACIILLLMSVTMVLRKQYTGFIVNDSNPMYLNSVEDIMYVIIPLLLWCVANWSLTTLMEGEGKFSEIFISSCYALIPLIIIYLPWIWMSNYIALEETVFYYYSNSFAAIWFIFLLFVGNMTIHQYTVAKTVGTFILTLLAMGFMAFLGLLFFSLIQQIVSFVFTIYQEFELRS